MCYFHVNAIPSVTMATSMIDRTGKVRGGQERKRKEVLRSVVPNASS